jgi:hypothetical protein
MNHQDETDDVESEPQPKSPPGMWSIVGAAVAILVSAVIAFFCTCFPVGLLAFEVGGGSIAGGGTPEQVERTDMLVIFVCVVGGCVAILVGYFVFRCFRKSWSK